MGTTISGEIKSTSADGGGNLVATILDFFTHFGNSKKINKKMHQFLSPFLKGLPPKHWEIFFHNSPMLLQSRNCPKAAIAGLQEHNEVTAIAGLQEHRG
jgi:hypothetical protein